MMLGEEPKNQERARFCEPDQVACAADGVSASPNAAEAAELAISLAPGLFKGNTMERLGMFCDLLETLRQECQQNEVSIPESVPEAMRPMLQRVIQEKRVYSYQTTLVTTQFTCDEQDVTTRTVKCGDSAFLAFSPKSGPLSTFVKPKWGNHKNGDHRHYTGLLSHGVRFGPGDEILVRVEGCLSQYDSLAKRTGIQEKHRPNWLVCIPVHASDTRASSAIHKTEHTLLLGPSDRLLVPKYLWGRLLESKGEQYRVLRYASSIRSVYSGGTNTSTGRFGRGTSTTTVLPDHFHCGHFDYLEDRFPLRTNFVLCSDGFYSCFAEADELWAWLQDHAKALLDLEERKSLLKRLHHRLDDTEGDDDISFVWVYPKPCEAAKETDQ